MHALCDFILAFSAGLAFSFLNNNSTGVVFSNGVICFFQQLNKKNQGFEEDGNIHFKIKYKLPEFEKKFSRHSDKVYDAHYHYYV